MRKKLYKAKKNWVIGLAAGTLLLVGGATTASADTNWNSSAAQFSQLATIHGPRLPGAVLTRPSIRV